MSDTAIMVVAAYGALLTILLALMGMQRMGGTNAMKAMADAIIGIVDAFAGLIGAIARSARSRHEERPLDGGADVPPESTAVEPSCAEGVEFPPLGSAIPEPRAPHDSEQFQLRDDPKE